MYLFKEWSKRNMRSGVCIFVQCSILINFNFDRLRRKPISTNNKSHIENQILIPENWSMIFEG